MSKKEISLDTLKAQLQYDAETGIFIWLPRDPSSFKQRSAYASWRARFELKIAGSLNDKGYRSICVCGTDYRANRLAWFYVHGAWPAGEIDHVNGVRDDNRLSNLRDVPHIGNCQNMRNNGRSDTSLRGAYKKGSRYEAIATINGARLRLGMFDTAAEANAAYERARSFSVQ